MHRPTLINVRRAMLKWFRRLGPTSIIAPIFTRNALSAATLPIYPGLGQAPNNAGWHTRWLGCLCRFTTKRNYNYISHSALVIFVEFFFCNSVTDMWNSLPASVNFTSLMILKMCGFVSLFD